MAMITVIAGAQMEFRPLLDAALRRGVERAGRDPEGAAAAWGGGLGGAGRDPEEAAAALGRLPRMPAFPEVPEALQRLRDGGLKLAILTQSASGSAEAVLANAGLREHFEHLLSAPEAGTFKPEDLAYHAALETLGA